MEITVGIATLIGLFTVACSVGGAMAVMRFGIRKNTEDIASLKQELRRLDEKTSESVANIQTGQNAVLAAVSRLEGYIQGKFDKDSD